MREKLIGVLLCASALAACANKPRTVDETPVQGEMQKADPVFLSGQMTGRSCEGDSQCKTAELCHPEQKVCFVAYPPPRMLDISFLVDKECKLVNIYFPYDSVELVPEAERWLSYNIRCMKSREVKALRLEAHCDARGSNEYNLKLSNERGEYVKKLMEKLGVTIPITVKGEGEKEPMRAGNTEKDYAFNRRVEFIPH